MQEAQLTTTGMENYTITDMDVSDPKVRAEVFRQTGFTFVPLTKDAAQALGKALGQNDGKWVHDSTRLIHEKPDVLDSLSDGGFEAVADVIMSDHLAAVFYASKHGQPGHYDNIPIRNSERGLVRIPRDKPGTRRPRDHERQTH